VTDDRRPTTADFLEDAAHYPGGHAAGVVFPRSTQDVVDAVAQHATLLPIGAQSSLTGGATPMGETILATSKMARIVSVTPRAIVVEPGVTVAAIQDALREVDAWFPPAPTYTGACAGGVVATNAAGAATFKYGSTRAWVDAITVVLADGTVLDIARGRQHAREGRFRLETRSGTIEVPVPRYRMPDVVKRSAGYHAEPGMDLIDLFIGSEGTLGIVTRITFRIASPAPLVAMGFVTCADQLQGLRLAGELRRASKETWRTGDRAGPDVSAIEHMDRRSLEIVHEDGVDRRHNVTIPADTRLALLVPLVYAFFLLTNSVAAASLSGARALEVDVDHQALLNLVLIAIAIVGYLVGVLLAAGLIGAFGFGVALAVVAGGLAVTAVGFRRPLLA
jgi:D-lactate dehydrogenase (cytochrome)